MSKRGALRAKHVTDVEEEEKETKEDAEIRALEQQIMKTTDLHVEVSPCGRQEIRMRRKIFDLVTRYIECKGMHTLHGKRLHLTGHTCKHAVNISSFSSPFASLQVLC